MKKPGVRITEDQPGTGHSVQKGDAIVITYSLFLNRGDVVESAQRLEFILGDRNVIAGLNYGIEGVREGGRQKFRAGPHLCYREAGVPGKIPANAVLIFDVTLLEIRSRTSRST